MWRHSVSVSVWSGDVRSPPPAIASGASTASTGRARDLGRVAGDDRELGARVARPELPEGRRQEVDRERGARPKADAPGDDPAELLDDFEARLELPQRAARVGEEQLARLRREGTLADALEERQAERLLE